LIGVSEALRDTSRHEAAHGDAHPLKVRLVLGKFSDFRAAGGYLLLFERAGDLADLPL
jgi:hypothetical protein